MNPIAIRALQSEYYVVRDTPTAGRGVFATKHIPAGTTLHIADDLSASIIYRPYRREVCVQCFDYDRGVSWPLRDMSSGLVFCSKKCRNAWAVENGDKVTLKAYQAVEALIKSRARKDKDEDMLDVAVETPPSLAEVERIWKAARTEGRRIVNARTALEPTKSESRALRVALSKATDPTVLPYLLSAVLVSHHLPEQWEAVLELKPTPTPYPSLVVLEQHVTAYHHLLSVLPESLLASTNPSVLLAAVDRDAHNSFGLRSLDDDGEEMLGFGVWASASYWNHSCAPCVDKDRVGRAWKFWAAKDIEAGEELCISYLGVDTAEMDVDERKKRLLTTWEFECRCEKCAREESGKIQIVVKADEGIQ